MEKRRCVHEMGNGWNSALNAFWRFCAYLPSTMDNPYVLESIGIHSPLLLVFELAIGARRFLTVKALPL